MFANMIITLSLDIVFGVKYARTLKIEAYTTSIDPHPPLGVIFISIPTILSFHPTHLPPNYSYF